MQSTRSLQILAGALALVHLAVGLTFSTVEPIDAPSFLDFARTLGDQFTFAKDAPVNLFRTPGYPVFLRAVWSIFGEQRTAVLAVQWLLLVGLALTVAYFVNTRLLKEPNLSLYPVSVLLFLFDPLLASSAYSQLSELLFACLIFATLFTWFDAMARPAPRPAALAGLWLGLASLTRPVSMFLPIVLAPLLVITAAPRRRALSASLIFVGISCALAGAWVVRNMAVAGIPSVTTAGVFNLAHYRAAGVLAEAEGISFGEADAVISSRIGPRVVQTAAGYARTRAVAMEILSDHPLLVAKQVARSSLFQLLDPGWIYIAQIAGASPRGSGVLSDFAIQGPSALVAYFQTMAAGPLVLLVYSLLFTGLVYFAILTGMWLAAYRESTVDSWIEPGNFRRWLTVVALVSMYFVGIQAGPEAAGRFRIPLLPLWHSVVLVTLSVVWSRARSEGFRRQ